MAQKGIPGAKGVMRGLTLKRALEIRENKYRSVQTVAGKRVEQDYDKKELDEFIRKAQEAKAEKEEKETEREERRLALFQEPETVKIINRHIKEIEKLENDKIVALMMKYRAVRHDLRDRLDTLKGDSFTAQKLRGVLIQVESALIQMKEVLKREMGEAGEEISIKGVNHTFEEIEKFEEHFTGAVSQIDLDAVLLASDNKTFLMNRYEASLSAYSEDLRARIAMALTTAAIEKASYSEVIRRLSSYFQGEEWKLHRIARTELHNIYNMSKQRTMSELKESGQMPELKKALFHPMDFRTGEDSKQAAEQNPIVEINEPFVYIYRRQRKDGTVIEEKRVFMANDRPNDRSVIIPYQEDWD